MAGTCCAARFPSVGVVATSRLPDAAGRTQAGKGTVLAPVLIRLEGTADVTAEEFNRSRLGPMGPPTPMAVTSYAVGFAKDSTGVSANYPGGNDRTSSDMALRARCIHYTIDLRQLADESAKTLSSRGTPVFEHWLQTVLR